LTFDWRSFFVFIVLFFSLFEKKREKERIDPDNDNDEEDNNGRSLLSKRKRERERETYPCRSLMYVKHRSRMQAMLDTSKTRAIEDAMK
jgi:hypothetical protein